MSKKWNEEHKKDHYYREAKKMKYRSRAAYKLLQLDKKFKIIRSGDKVLDLGAAPGGWSQIALEKVGPTGLVVAVDLKSFKNFSEPNFCQIVGDITEEEILSEIERTINDKVDVILSDASPKLSGVKDVDQLRALDLAIQALHIASMFLKKDGNMLIKVFQGEEFPRIHLTFKKKFRKVKTTKPPSSRKASGEMYLVARGYRK